ncbi:orotidine monophosphate decarboxylase [Exidia glandulosa HHB12029]|uniref:Orotidine 5'-phosphate decarboxylase n=1 Tax=Exidia glandulosa HHB12029 TaxID=1314781 RepID=A0A165QU67_EXIGL|nr:orotidine monophosphate decarboxylase [Exidia glandulosa HHB12029]
MASSKAYGDRVASHSNRAAQDLLRTMERKQSNLCVSVDVTSKAAFLAVVEAVGPFVCLIKTHVDVIADFDADLVEQLTQLAAKHDFLIFEDRKFADIGNTVSLQYAGGIYKIASWSHITNAHTVPGPGIIAGLAKVGLPLGRGLLLLAEMSSAGNLATGAYSDQTIAMARAHRDFVVGFIAMQRPSGPADEDFLILTPGVQLGSKGDALGQQYRTPREVVFDSGCDVIIVGRGVTGSGESINVEEVQHQARRYRDEGWSAYRERIASN